MKNQNVKALFNASESMQTGKHRKNIIETFKINVSIQKVAESEKSRRINGITLLVKKTANQVETLAEIMHKRFSIQFPAAEIKISCKIIKEAGPIDYGYAAGEKFVELS